MENSLVMEKDGHMPYTENFISYILRCEKLYIVHKYNIGCQDDYLICNEAGITYTQYKDAMKNRFNAKLNKYDDARLPKGAYYFEKVEDVKKALEWLESMVIMNKLKKVR